MQNIATLRDILFAELEAIPPGAVLSENDRLRIGTKCALADRVIDAVRLEVHLAAVLKGGLTIPFIEEQAPERPSSGDPHRRLEGEGADADSRLSPEEKMIQALKKGPSANHWWRGLGRREKD
ncbi:MAG: hypothetical protein DI563_02585 [Variovorax paradoxus]|uniref:Uncharacterized protein n=1 Tax=Variovorax paradoxus TaxID=34073 RepID=A0A2W5S4W7_VARPD|nr:MAG: hypothetical protein DI563_02585 [Variovorax paradoxus]